MLKGIDFKKGVLPYLSIIAIFFAVSLIFCSPVLEGKTLFQTDTRKGAAMGQDVKKYSEETGEKSLWTGASFGGMPTYQISPSYKTFPFSNVRKIFEAGLPSPASHLFLYMLGFFILMCAFKVKPWIGALGAIAYAFSSYFIIIITAGHIWKVMVLGLIPPTLAGVVWAYRGKYLIGSAVFALFFTLQLFANHIQMTYYFFVFAGLPYLVFELSEAIRNKKMLVFSKATGALLAGAILAVGVNFTSLYFTAKYSKDTIRGKSELTSNASDKTSGLDKSYATDWSYGIGETFSLLVPDVKGGGNAAIGTDEKYLKDVNPAFKNDIANSDRYWGDQPFTAGPVYVGAFVLFLFILGLFIVESRIKWALLFSTVISILLAWGKNWMPLTDFFLDYFPMYNKFRTVSSILIVAELTIPILAVLSLMEIVKKPDVISPKSKSLWISFALTGGLALLFWVMPKTFFDFFSQRETAQFADYMQQNPGASGQISSYMAGLESARIAILRSDAIRSFIIIAVGLALLLMYQRKTLKKGLLSALLLVLVLGDLWLIDKRYLNDSHFVPKRETAIAWPMTEADKVILEDKDLGYRVINLTVSPFQDASTSYYHRSVGGYHAAKLRRYQEVIEKYFGQNISMPVLNMLNTRYFIVPGDQQGGAPLVQRNPDALGAAWVVGKYTLAKNADEEIDAIGKLNPSEEIVVDERYAENLQNKSFVKDTSAIVKLSEYAPDRLVYDYTSKSEQLVVFSEIFYKDGWKAEIDGKPAPHFCANYILRAMVVPEGNHKIVFAFQPDTYNNAEAISVASLIGLILLILGSVAFEIIKTKKKKSA